MGSICLDWMEENRTPHSCCHPWRIWNCSKNVYLCLSWFDRPFYAMYCPGNMPPNQQQTLPIEKGHWWYRWTVKKSYVVTNNQPSCDLNYKTLLKDNKDNFSPYPSSTSVNWTITIYCCVLIEILRHRQTQENRETQNELCSEGIKIAELKKAKTSGTCTYER